MYDQAASGPSRSSRLILIGIGGCALALLIWVVDLDRLATAITAVDMPLFAFAASLVLLVIVIRAFRWHVLLRVRRIGGGFGPALLATMIGQLLGIITPGQLGELARAVPFAKDVGADVTRVIPSVIVDRMLDLALLILIAIPAVIGAFQLFAVRSTSYAIPLLVLVALAIPLVVRPRIAEAASACIRRWFAHRRALAWAADLLAEYAAYLRALTAGPLIIVIVLTLGGYFIFFLEAYLVAIALGMDQGFWTLVFAVTLGAVVALVPISFSGIGTRDAAIVAYLGLHGVGPAQALAFSLLLFLAFQVVGGVTGLAAWAYRGRLG